MQSLKRQTETYLASHPWQMLGMSFVLGILVVFLFPNAQAPRSAIPGFKEGFLIVLGTTKLLDPAGDLQLKGSKVQFVRRGMEGIETTPCRIVHPPLTFAANERNMSFTGSLEDLEATALAIAPDDLRHVDLAAVHDAEIAPCNGKVKIVYGQEG